MIITKKAIDQMEADERSKYLWDDQLSGFGVKVLKSGRKSFILKYRSGGGGRAAKQSWLKLGNYGALTLAQARKIAQQELAAIARGEDPQALKRANREEPLLKDAWIKFQEDELHLKKASTVSDYVSMWENIISPTLGNRRISELTRQHFSDLHRKLRDTPYRANRSLALASKLMTLTEQWEWRQQGTNPCKYIERYKEASRERFLSNDEIHILDKSMLSLIEDGELTPQIRHLVLLLLLTGARKREIMNCKWEWVDIDRRLILLPDSKTGKKSLYLSEIAKEILLAQRELSIGHDWVFPGAKPNSHLINMNKAWGRIRTKANLPALRIHDLRHASASIAVNEGIGLAIIGRVLGHKNSRTTERYAHVQNQPALDAVNRVGAAIGNSITFKKER